MPPALSKTRSTGDGAGSVYRDRLDEDGFFRNGVPPALGNDVIRHVRCSFVGENDLALLFETATRRYAFVIVLQDRGRMGWKECQAVADALRVAERGTKISNELFGQIFEQFKRKYGRCEGPRVDRSILLGYVYPVKGTLENEGSDVIRHTGIAFDEDGDVLLRSRTFGGQEYSVCVELTTKDHTLPSKRQSLYKLDCKVLLRLLSMLETGDKVDQLTFLAYMAELRKDFNFVRVDKFDHGRVLTATILASRAKNPELMQDVLRRAMSAVEKKDKVPPSGSSTPAAPSERGAPGLRCPYPGVVYTKRLKESGQARVYAGRFEGKDVAVKVFMEEDCGAVYKRELTMLLKMAKHPNVIDVLDFHERPEPAVVMNLVKGRDLMDFLEHSGKMTSKGGRRVAGGIADGLAHLHKNGIVHRDLKSSNILVDENKAPIIIDLGLGGTIESRQKPRGAMDMTLVGRTLPSMQTNSGITMISDGILGTVLWLPPEMITKNEWSTKTDVYSFGIVLWEMLSGKIPFIKPREEPTSTELMIRIASGERPDMADVRDADDELKALMVACWDPDPALRPSMRTVVDVLRGNDPRAIFQAVDHDGSGCLDFAEFVTFLMKYAQGKVAQSEMHVVFQAIDRDGDGSISLKEFLEFWRLVDAAGLEKALKDCRKRDDSEIGALFLD